MKTPTSGRAGQLDPQFGHDGLLKVEIPSGDFTARAVLNAQRAIHLVGVLSSEPSAATLLKLDAEGQLDTSFGTGGMVMHRMLDGYELKDLRSAIQTDGRILVVALCTPVAGESGAAGVVVLRCLGDGRLDASFGDGGVMVWREDWTTASTNAGVALQSDGGIVVAGWGSAAGTGVNVVLKLLIDGRFDPVFGQGGVVREMRGLTRFSDVVVNEEGLVLVGGYNDGVAAIFCYQANGEPDRAFSGDGIMHLPDLGSSTMHFNGIALQPDGAIVGAGFWGKTMTMETAGILTRVNAVGELDAEFNEGEVLLLPAPLDQCLDVLVDDAGRIVTLGRVKSDVRAIAVCRWLGDGTPDPSFGMQGTFIFHVPAAIEPPATALMQDVLAQWPDKVLVNTLRATSTDARIGPVLARVLT